MIHTYSILKRYRIVIQCHKGPVSGEDMKRVKLAAMKDPDFDPGFNFLVDLRDTEIVMNNQELMEYESWLCSHPVLSHVEKFAIYTNSPGTVERAFEYVKNAGLRIDFYMIFTTLSSAMNWLQIDPSEKQHIENKLKSLINATVSV